MQDSERLLRQIIPTLREGATSGMVPLDRCKKDYQAVCSFFNIDPNDTDALRYRIYDLEAEISRMDGWLETERGMNKGIQKELNRYREWQISILNALGIPASVVPEKCQEMILESLNKL